MYLEVWSRRREYSKQCNSLIAYSRSNSHTYVCIFFVFCRARIIVFHTYHKGGFYIYKANKMGKEICCLYSYPVDFLVSL